MSPLDLCHVIITVPPIHVMTAGGASAATYNFLSALQGLTGVIAGVKRGEVMVVG